MTSVSMRVDIGGIDGYPHTFLVVTHPDGRVLEYGFVPKVTGLWGPGDIDITGQGTEDGPHEAQYEGPTEQLSDTQYQQLMDYINQSIANPPYYIVSGTWTPGEGTNCTGWAVDAWQDLGLPSIFGVTNPGTWNPYGQALNIIINPTVNTNFLDARNIVIQVDPLVLDLDGDGLELTGASGAILFDHNADGIKTGTGWAGRDDGFLVRDLNGNGTIDTGRELFGVDTIKSNNTLATQGFDALKDLDSNADGQITSADAAYGQLKVWQDANQDGISQSTELKTLAQHGITRIGLNGTSTGPQAGQTINNNQVALSTTFTQNGQTKTVGAIDLEANNFFTEFPTEVVDETGNTVAITEQALSLPQMNGTGMVRNMREAASLDGGFAAALSAFAAGTTRAEQRGMLGELMTKRLTNCCFTIQTKSRWLRQHTKNSFKRSAYTSTF